VANYPCFITNCGGTIVVRKDRGHDAAGCDRCHRCVSFEELLTEIDRLRARDHSMREWLRTLLAKVDALLNGPAVVDFDEAAKRAREAEERR
jgi:hypothetical protein